LACWFWIRIFSKIFFQKHVKLVFPIVAPYNPWAPWFVQSWICTISGSFCVNLIFSDFVVREKIFKWPHPIFAILWLFPLWEGLGLWVAKILNSLISKNDLYQVWLKLACWFWRKIFKVFPKQTQSCKNGFPHCSPYTQPRGP
jgi:hypothetical protein